jgi:outer membrane receptor protein involved in Fe transport
LTFASDTVWNYELGTRTNWLDHRLTFDVTAFDIEWSKIQALQQVGAFYVFSNAGNARVNGLEFESAFQPIQNLTLSANATYTHSELLEDNADFGAVKGETLPYTAKWSGSLSADYTHPLGDRWALTGGALYHATSRRFTDFSQASDRYTLKAYGELDLRIGLVMNNTTLSLYAKNALDKRAYTSLALDAPPEQLEMNVNQPRTIGVGVARTF